MVLPGVREEVECRQAWQEASGGGTQEFYGAVLGCEGKEEVWGIIGGLNDERYAMFGLWKMDGDPV